MTDDRKKSLYFPAEDLAWLHVQTSRLGRSYSWVVKQALDYARNEIEKLQPQKMGEK